MIDKEKNVRPNYRSCLVIIVLFIILVPTMSIINNRINSNIEYIYFMDVIETDSYMAPPQKMILDEEGDYVSVRDDDDSIVRIFDNSSRVLYYMNIKEQSFSKIENSRFLGGAYQYNNRLYYLLGHGLMIEENGAVITDKRLFSANVESDVYIDNMGIVSLKHGGLRGVNLDTKKIVWSNNREGLGNNISFLVHEKDVYYTHQGNLYKLNYKTGDEVMVRELQPSGDGDRFPLIIDGDYIYTGGNYIHKVDFRTWKTMSKIEMKPYRILIDDDYIYVCTNRPTYDLYKIDKETFEIAWCTKLYDGAGARFELLADYINVENSNNEVGLIDKDSGEFVWTKRFNEEDGYVDSYGQEEYLVIVKTDGEILYYDTNTLKK